MKVALITGICGQDGSYLAELLLDKDYEVWGIIRRCSQINTQRIEHLYHHQNLYLRYGDLSDSNNILKIMGEIKEKYFVKNNKSDEEECSYLEIYNLGAMSHVKVSFDMPSYCADVNGRGTLQMLEAIRTLSLEKVSRFYQASTSELYGKVQETPQNEKTPFYPRSPYAVSKLYAYWIVKNYREAYGLYACNGILFNHESPRRGPTFITRKITRGLQMILSGERDRLIVGNLDAKRDWGHAKDYVVGMWLMLQQDTAKDYVLATGETNTVRYFIEKSFALRGFNIKWKGTGVDEIGYDEKTGRELIFCSEKYYRPTEVDILLGDPSLAEKELGWTRKYDLDLLVEEMVKSDCPVQK